MARVGGRSLPRAAGVTLSAIAAPRAVRGQSVKQTAVSVTGLGGSSWACGDLAELLGHRLTRGPSLGDPHSPRPGDRPGHWRARQICVRPAASMVQDRLFLL